MTIFSKIINGEIPCYKIAEDEHFIAFLDIQPLAKGHVLVVPKLEIDQFFDLPNTTLSQLFIFAKPIAKAIETCFACNRCGISVVGLEVPHAHVHLIPITTADNMNFNNEKLKLSAQEFTHIQELLVNCLAFTK